MIGQTRRFTYPDYGTPVGFPDLAARSGQQVTILARTPTDDGVEPLWKVRWIDGYESDVWDSELSSDAPQQPPLCAQTGKRHDDGDMTTLAIDGRRVLTCSWCDWQFHYHSLTWVKALPVGGK